MAGPATRRLRMVVAYDGAPFSGFARQPGRRTVQGELEATLAELAGAPVAVVCAGRTDAGVHARGQVVHADLPERLDPERVRRVLNAVAGPAIVVREAAWAPGGFDARFSARRRTYVYRIDDSGSLDPPQAPLGRHPPGPGAGRGAPGGGRLLLADGAQHRRPPAGRRRRPPRPGGHGGRALQRRPRRRGRRGPSPRARARVRDLPEAATKLTGSAGAR